MEIRYNRDEDTGLPHIYGHGVSEAEVEQVLSHPLETRRAGRDSRAVIGQTDAGRYLRVIVVPDPAGDGVFVVTAYDLTGKPLAALRRRQRRRGR
ncbi:MAG: DUF4258 domain-containing protein [Chloroflexi bacterium]|nr:MAG: DUF4258 domain-containing protein [Chloroflexota bacterium]